MQIIYAVMGCSFVPVFFVMMKERAFKDGTLKSTAASKA
jgi:hypothetical protein